MKREKNMLEKKTFEKNIYIHIIYARQKHRLFRTWGHNVAMSIVEGMYEKSG